MNELNPKGLQIGMVVELIENYPDENKDLTIGCIGTIKDMEESDWSGMRCAVEWEPLIENGHTCCGACADGHGWWVNEESLEEINFKIDEEKFVSDFMNLMR